MKLSVDLECDKEDILISIIELHIEY